MSEKTIEFGPGCHVSEAAQLMMTELLSEKNHEEGGKVGDFTVKGAFNGTTLVARKGSTTESILADFTAQMAANAEVYRKSPEGKAAAREQAERLVQMQLKHDVLMKKLPSLDFSSHIAVIDWLCEFQDPSDHIGVVKQQDVIVAIFATRGYHPSVNTGDAFDGSDQDNFARYIVGQALDMLQGSVGAIHQIIHKFADDWKEKFLPASAT